LFVKYNMLSPTVQQEVNDFLDFVLTKHKGEKAFDMKVWKSKIKNVSVWSPADIQMIEESRDQFKDWKTEEW
ncbi:MAG: hypothetical protein AAGA66_14170, partial [Bacteroidota bacterium]